MSRDPRGPSLEDLVGDVAADERERLLGVHELLVAAGPPPELPPHLEAGPTLGMTLGGHRHERRAKRRVALLAAAIVILLVAFLAGYITGNDQTASGRVLRLAGTAAAPGAQASLRIEDADRAGNWPMELAALGLPRLPARGYYEVFLVRKGEQEWAPCGSFLVRSAKEGVDVRLNAPYRFHAGDTWVVTKQKPGDHTAGPVVLRPLT